MTWLAIAASLAIPISLSAAISNLPMPKDVESILTMLAVGSAYVGILVVLIVMLRPRVRQFASDFCSFRAWNHGGMRGSRVNFA
ncbi:MAG TPA: hypothetical protein VFN09_10870, partial [Rhodanobacteraceae bacterium]|nr:hypothetical protein [Rhodanobacteraceae bacterium]